MLKKMEGLGVGCHAELILCLKYKLSCLDPDIMRLNPGPGYDRNYSRSEPQDQRKTSQLNDPRAKINTSIHQRLQSELIEERSFKEFQSKVGHS
jgi:hypothetical protein